MVHKASARPESLIPVQEERLSLSNEGHVVAITASPISEILPQPEIFKLRNLVQ